MYYILYMEEMLLNYEQKALKVKKFLKLDNFDTNTRDIQEKIKEMCVTKLCNILGINYAYNYKSEFFKMYSEVLGQAICDILKINFVIADDKFRLFKYDGKNIIEECKKMLINAYEDEILLEESILDIFNFVDELKSRI